MDQRVMIGRQDDGPWWLGAIERGTMWPAINLDDRGLRVAFRGVAGDIGPAFDAYAGSLGIRIIDGDGASFAASVVIAQRGSLASPAAPPAVHILAHRQQGSATTAAITARLESD